MTLPPPVYDLVILLDPEADQDARAKIVEDTRAAIEAQGELLRHDRWGERSLSYPIERRTSAEYQLLQFHATPELLAGLERTLRITDGVLRFRIIKLRPGVPEVPAAGAAGEQERARGGAPEAPAPPGDAPAPRAEVEVEVEVAEPA